MTIWRIAWWIPRAADTHSEYVIIIDLPLQQWLHEIASQYYITLTLPLLLFFSPIFVQNLLFAL